MITNSWDNTATVILIQRVNKYSPAEEMVTWLHSLQLILKNMQKQQEKQQWHNNTKFNITLSNVCFVWRSNCDSQDSAIESAKDMFQYVLKRACMGSSKWQRSLWREYIVLSHGLLWHI